MPAANVLRSELSDDDQKKLEWLLVEFDRQWREGSLAEHAGRLDAAAPLRPRALAEMVKIDLERPWGMGRPTTVESYLTTYPELGTPETLPAELIQAEFQVRRQFGDPADIDDYCRRFPRQAAELRQLIEESKLVMSDTELSVTGRSTV